MLDPETYKLPPYNYTCKKCGAFNHKLKAEQEWDIEKGTKMLFFGVILGMFAWVLDIAHWRRTVKARRCASCGWKFPGRI